MFRALLITLLEPFMPFHIFGKRITTSEIDTALAAGKLCMICEQELATQHDELCAGCYLGVNFLCPICEDEPVLAEGNVCEFCCANPDWMDATCDCGNPMAIHEQMCADCREELEFALLEFETLQSKKHMQRKHAEAFESYENANDYVLTGV